MRSAFGGIDATAWKAWAAQWRGRWPAVPTAPDWRGTLAGARETCIDGLAAALAMMRTLAHWLGRAGGETRFALIFAASLAALTILPKPQPQALPEPALRPAVPLAFEAPEPAALPYARAPWKAVRPQLAAYGLDAPEFGGNAPLYRIRTSPDGARQDLLAFPPRDDQPYSGIVFIERGSSRERLSDTLYVDAARRAAVAGASIERFTRPTPADSKFGSFEVSDVQVIQQGRLRACLAFRLLTEAPLGIAGLLCGSPQAPADRTRLACVLDRIDLIGAGDDRVLRQYFAHAERGRVSCGRAIPRGPALKQVIFDTARMRG